ncbi:DEAD/DEAH box helicase [Legionella cincinnatiensis]|nr:DEAD/DEAH box helicase family protein [Legionella cincinnatiensis]
MREWQKEAFDKFKDAPLMILNAPMGSGKSWMMCFLSAFKLKHDPKLRCVITVPQTIIASGFIKEKLMMPDGEKIFWLAGHDLCSNKQNEGTIRYVIKWLGSNGNLLSDRILVCTHATIALVYKKLYEERQLDLLSNLLLWVDEAHHVTSSSSQDEQLSPINTSNALGKLVSYLFHSSSSNNQIGLATATYFRGDQRNLIPNEMEKEFKRYNLPYDRYLETMTHLRSFNFDFIICGQDYTNAIEGLVKERKKDIVYIPRPNSLCSTGNKHQEVKNIISQYQGMYGEQENQENKILITLTKGDESFKILDLVDECNREQKKSYLCGKTIKEHRHDVDVIITLGMFKEGANWVWAERSIIIGTRSSLVDTIQMIGRLFRDAENKNHVEVVHLLPFSLEQKDEIVFRENLNNYLKAIYASLILENIFNPVTIQIPKSVESEKNSSIPEHKPVTNWLSKLVPDEIQQSLLFEDIINHWIDIPVGAPKEEFLKSAEPILDKYDIKEHRNELLTQILGQLTRRTLYMSGLSVDEINFDILQDTHALGFLLRYTSGSSDINTFQKLREAIQRGRPPLTMEIIETWIEQFFNKYQKYPLRNDSLIEFAEGNYYGDTWSRIDTALREGLRGLPVGSSLAKLMDTKFGVRNSLDLPQLDTEEIKACMLSYFNNTGKWPDEKSGVIPELPYDTWSSIGSALHKGTRNLPKISLAELRNQLIGRSCKLNLETIRKCINTYHEREGKWPNRNSGAIPELPGDDWSIINSALKSGSRGLLGGSSLALMLSADFGVRNEKNLPDLDIETIKKCMLAHCQRTNTWPNERSGEILELPGETWNRVGSALYRGKRGLPKSSLATLKESFGEKNHYNSPKLTIEEIISWIQAYHNETGNWPTDKSGVIAYAPYKITWCAVNIALKDGLRGLAGGSTLPKLLNEIFGVRNPKDLPDLNLKTIRKCINAHHDREGKCPNRDSGTIPELPGETWSAVITALTKGSRGLEKGWNITKLRKELVNE